MAVPPAGHVATCGIDRDRLLTGDHAGNDLKLYVVDGRFLRLRKAFYVVVGKLDVALYLLGDFCNRCVDFFLGQKDIALVAIKLGRVFQSFCVAARFDIVEDVLDDFVGFRGVRLGRQRCLLEIFTGHVCDPAYGVPDNGHCGHQAFDSGLM